LEFLRQLFKPIDEEVRKVQGRLLPFFAGDLAFDAIQVILGVGPKPSRLG
jgi:hypothetical protein